MTVKMETEATTLPAQERKPQETIDSRARGDVPLRWFTTLLMLVFPTAVLFVNRADSYSFWLLVLIGIWVWIRHGARPFLDRWSGALLLAFALFFGVTVLAYLCGFQTQDGFRFLGRYLRFLFIAPVLLTFRRYPPTAKTVFIGLALGALVGGTGSIWHFLHVHYVKLMEAATDLHIIFGDLATTMVLCTVAGFGLMAASRRNWAVPMLVLSVAGGVAATLLSGARGAWIPLLLLLPALMTSLGNYLKSRYILGFLVVLVVVCSSFYLAIGKDSRQRITGMGRNIYDYFAVLHYVHKRKDGAGYKVGCMTDPGIMKAWLAAGYIPFGALDDRVEPDQTLTQETPCAGDDVISLHNSSIKQDIQGVPYIVLPRYPGAPATVQKTKIWVRGTGFASLDFRGDAVVKFDSTRYRLIYVSAANDTTGTSLNIGLSPGKTLWFVPVEGYAGEYAYPLADTSVGQRLAMWRAAWMLFLSHPLLGVGTGAYQPSTDRLIAEGKIMPTIASYDHPHNDYLNALASAGIVGFLVLLAVLLLPAWFFIRAVCSGDRVTHALGLGGLFTVIGFAIYALTDVVFLHNMMIIWYVVYVALFYALIQAGIEKRQQTN